MTSEQKQSKSKRLRERIAISLPVRVRCRESLSREWVEIARLQDVSPFGASLMLVHPMETGRILHLTMPLPRPLRAFDYAEDQYKVWGLVRHVGILKETKNRNVTSQPNYTVGVAFIGKRPPESYQKDPTTRYDADGFDEGGLINLREMEMSKDWSSRRRSTRLGMPLEIRLESFDEHGKVESSEETVTENISRHGALVYTSLNLECGRFVRVTSLRQQLSAVAVVRGRRIGADRIPRLHLEFVGQEWELEGI
ncbi:MAG: hypothetical protein NVSMB56_12770 [Pyrinomonadaceae bacterium]